MGKLSLDLAGRLPALELITPSRPVRELINPAEPFDFHLRQAQQPSSQPGPLQRSKSPAGSDLSDSTTRTRSEAMTQQSTEDSQFDSEESVSAQTETETETSDTDYPESQAAEVATEGAALSDDEEHSLEEDATSEQDEVILNEKAVQLAQLPQDGIQQAQGHADLPITDNVDGESAPIDVDSNSDQQGKNSNPEKIDNNTSVKSVSETKSSQLVLENEEPEVPGLDHDQLVTETKKTSPEETVNSAVKKAPLVSLPGDNTESTDTATEKASDEITAKQTSDEGVDSQKESDRKHRTVKKTGNEESSQEENARNTPTRDPKGDANPRVSEQFSTSGTSQDKAGEKFNPSGPSVPLEVQQGLNADTDSNTTDTQPQANSTTTSSDTTVKVSLSREVQTSVDNSTAVRKTDFTREVTINRGGKAHTHTTATDVTVSVDRAKFVLRVSRAMHISHERGGEIRLRLSPPELGSLTIEIQLKDGVLTAQVEAETTAAQKLLVDNLSQLKDRLAEQQIRVDRFDVELADQSTQNSLGGQHQGSAEQRHARGPLRDQPSGTQTDTDVDTTTEAQTISTNAGQLNVVI